MTGSDRTGRSAMWPFCSKLMKLIEGGGDGDDGDERHGDDEERRLFPSQIRNPAPHRCCYIDVPHLRQRFDWDCGLACVAMVLRTLGFHQYDIHDLEQLCSTTSIWTVDLAYLLHKFSVSFTFLTVTLGANPEYSAESYYSEQLQDDRGRVNRLFENAFEAGIVIQCRSISGKDLSMLILSGQYIAVALVDKIKLSQSWPVHIHDTECYGRNSEYMGHYVLICGYDADTGEFEIRDPASSRKHEKVSMENLDEARKSFGTDEDILLISLIGKDIALSRQKSYDNRYNWDLYCWPEDVGRPISMPTFGGGTGL